jgi:hypothetical protein
MNERIKQLWSEAAESNFGDSWEEQTAFMSKFAELIVRECANVCRDQPNTYALKTDRDNCAIAVEQHFGVEE